MGEGHNGVLLVHAHVPTARTRMFVAAPIGALGRHGAGLEPCEVGGWVREITASSLHMPLYSPREYEARRPPGVHGQGGLYVDRAYASPLYLGAVVHGITWFVHLLMFLFVLCCKIAKCRTFGPSALLVSVLSLPAIHLRHHQFV